MLCDIVSRKNNKFAILQIFLKGVLTNDLSCLKFHELQGKCLCYGQIHEIVCLNEPILCTHIRLYVANNVFEGRFRLYFTKKPFSIFWVPEREFFVKHVPRIRFKMVPHHLKKYIRSHFKYNSPTGSIQELSSQLSEKRQVWADLVGTLPNLNYKYFVICSRFFFKIIFRYTTCELIRDTVIVLQDSLLANTPHARRFDRVLNQA